MDAAELTRMAMQEAQKEINADAPKETAQEAEQKKAVQDGNITEWLERMAQERPNDIVDPSIYGEMTKVPGYDRLTLGICTLYEIRYTTLVYLGQLRSGGEVYEPHIVTTSQGLHIVRGFSRREWSSIQRKIIQETRSRMEKHQESDSDPRWVEADLQMCTEELVVMTGSVQPKYDKDTVRSIPTGIVTYLSNSILRASGHEDQQLPPIPLK